MGPLWIHLWLLPVLVGDVVAIDAEPADPQLETIAIESCSGALGSGSCRSDGDRAEPADWFARVIWSEPEHLRARIEIRRRARDAPPSSVRTVEFSAADEPAQRERAVGLIIAAFVLEHARAEGTETAAEPATAAAQPAPERRPEIEIAPDPEPRAHAPVWGVDVALLAAPGFDRGSPRLGAVLRGLFRPFDPPLAIVLGIRAARRWDDEDPSVLWLGATAGLALHVQTPARPLAVEARAELQLQRVQVEAEDPVSRAHDSGGASRLGGQLGLEAHVALGNGSGGVSLFAGGEITALFPSVYLEVGGLETGVERNLGWGALVGLRVAD